MMFSDHLIGLNEYLMMMIMRHYLCSGRYLILLSIFLSTIFILNDVNGNFLNRFVIIIVCIRTFFKIAVTVLLWKVLW